MSDTGTTARASSAMPPEQAAGQRAAQGCGGQHGALAGALSGFRHLHRRELGVGPGMLGEQLGA